MNVAEARARLALLRHAPPERQLALCSKLLETGQVTPKLVRRELPAVAALIERGALPTTAEAT